MSFFNKKTFNIFLFFLVITLVLAQSHALYTNHKTKTVSQSTSSYSCSITLSLQSAKNKDIRILKDGIELCGFDDGKALLPVEASCIIELYNPSSHTAVVTIDDIRGEIELISSSRKIKCKKGITYICRIIK